MVSLRARAAMLVLIGLICIAVCALLAVVAPLWHFELILAALGAGLARRRALVTAVALVAAGSLAAVFPDTFPRLATALIALAVALLTSLVGAILGAVGGSLILVGSLGTKRVSGDVFRAVFNANRPAADPELRSTLFDTKPIP